MSVLDIPIPIGAVQARTLMAQSGQRLLSQIGAVAAKHLHPIARKKHPEEGAKICWVSQQLIQ